MEKIWKCQSVPIWQMSQKNVKNWKFCHTIYYQQGIHHSHVNQQPVKTSEILAWNLVCTLFFLGTYHSGPQQRVKTGRGMNERKHKMKTLILSRFLAIQCSFLPTYYCKQATNTFIYCNYDIITCSLYFSTIFWRLNLG